MDETMVLRARIVELVRERDDLIAKLTEIRESMALVMVSPEPDDVKHTGVFKFIEAIPDANEAKETVAKMARMAIDAASRTLISEMFAQPPERRNFVTASIYYNAQEYALTMQRCAGKTPAEIIRDRDRTIAELRQAFVDRRNNNGMESLHLNGVNHYEVIKIFTLDGPETRTELSFDGVPSVGDVLPIAFDSATRKIRYYKIVEREWEDGRLLLRVEPITHPVRGGLKEW